MTRNKKGRFWGQISPLSSHSTSLFDLYSVKFYAWVGEKKVYFVAYVNDILGKRRKSWHYTITECERERKRYFVDIQAILWHFPNVNLDLIFMIYRNVIKVDGKWANFCKTLLTPFSNIHPFLWKLHPLNNFCADFDLYIFLKPE